MKPMITGTSKAGLGLIGLGAMVLLFSVLTNDMLPAFFHWFAFIWGPGLLFVIVGLSGEELGKPFIPFGAVILTTGAVLAYQDLADHFQSWAYAWILIGPVAVGSGLCLYGWLHDDQRALADGRPLAIVGLTVFFLAAVFFELIVGVSGFGIAVDLPLGWLLGFFLMAAGIAVLTLPLLRGSSSQSTAGD